MYVWIQLALVQTGSEFVSPAKILQIGINTPNRSLYLQTRLCREAQYVCVDQRDRHRWRRCLGRIIGSALGCSMWGIL